MIIYGFGKLWPDRCLGPSRSHKKVAISATPGSFAAESRCSDLACRSVSLDASGIKSPSGKLITRNGTDRHIEHGDFSQHGDLNHTLT